MKTLLYITLLFFFATAQSQSDIDLLLKKYNTRSVPYISVQELHSHLDDYLILDTRKKEEYEVSHIKGAVWVSEKRNDSLPALVNVKKNQPIIVYCSVGIRSEDFGESLQEKGFTNIQNLYGSIFAWKDEGYEVLNHKEQPTDSVHTFSKVWSKYLKTGKKVY